MLGLSVAGWGLLLSVHGATAQTCTTQAKMSPEMYAAVSSTAQTLADEIKTGDSVKLQSQATPDIAMNFNSAAYLVQSTAGKISIDHVRLAQVYLLDATKPSANASGAVEFSCPLAGVPAETDFSFSSLPAGLYAFAMIEAEGPRPWLLALVLEQQGGVWKLAGFSAHARSAGGHDGLWYWTTARQRAKDGQSWLAWLLYGQAEALLRPAAFVSSTNLDKLGAEESAVRPAALADGLSAETPLVVKGADGAEYRITALSADGSDDGKRLNLMLHVKKDGSSVDAAEAKALALGVAKAFVGAHKELRTGFDGVLVFVESTGRDPVVQEFAMNEVP